MVYVLKDNPSKSDTSWQFTNVPANELHTRPPKGNRIPGKMIKFTAERIILQSVDFPSNRILHDDDPSQFLLASFTDLRLPDSTLSENSDYITTFLKAGLFINGVQYRFYHHSNSQLRSRTCFLRRATSDAELDNKIYAFGDYIKIMNVAKRAKRIGLLFSEASLDLKLDPRLVADIPDLISGDGEVFSDGCGLISKNLSVQLSRAKRIIFKGKRYVPSVFQIRYRGYKGVLSYDPNMPEGILAQFRKSMKKFNETAGNYTFSVVNYSKPFTFGRLNNDVIVLLSGLKISNDVLLKKQKEYFQWITDAASDLEKAFNFLSALGKYEEAERLLLEDQNRQSLVEEVKRCQVKELSDFQKEGTTRFRSRILVEKSRLLFGICDPYGVLKEGQIHVRIRTAKGDSTAIHTDCLVVRNPCLHPGDCLKLRAVQDHRLNNCVDCIVFSAVAKPGRHSAPSMSSGGDLDGDQYFVCWDPELVPKTVAQPYDYPPNKEITKKEIIRQDLATHFARYNNASLARVVAFHGKWARSSDKGAMCSECQELNALHSQSVDGAPIKIPERLTNPPEPKEYIIDLLRDAAIEFQHEFHEKLGAGSLQTLPAVDQEQGVEILRRFLQNPRQTLTEYELFNLIMAFARKHQLSHKDIMSFIDLLDWSALASLEKHAITTTLNLDPSSFPQIWNSLFRSDLIGTREIFQRNLQQPFSLQRLYSSRSSGLGPFWRYLRQATQDFTRKLILIKTDARFVLAVFIRGEVPWTDEPVKSTTEHEDPPVSQNVVVCSFMPQTSDTMSTYKTCPSGFRLHLSKQLFQLYDRHRANTFVFISRPPRGSEADVIASVALQKLSNSVQRQIGRVNRAPVTEVEMHVVSNRDRISSQAFDQWFEHVQTEERLGRFDHERRTYRQRNISEIDWTDEVYRDKIKLKEVFQAHLHIDEERQHVLASKTDEELLELISFGLRFHQIDAVSWIFLQYLHSRRPPRPSFVENMLKRSPGLVFVLLHEYAPDVERATLVSDVVSLRNVVLHALICCANELGMAALSALERVSSEIARISLDHFAELLWFTANSIRAQQLAQEILLVLNDSRNVVDDQDPTSLYARKHLLAVAFDRAEEAFMECPCGEEGMPRRQRTAPAHVKLSFMPETASEDIVVKAPMRVDSRFPARLHSHVRLQASSDVENAALERPPMMDGLVTVAPKGELHITIAHPPPPEMEDMDWKLYHAGSVATAKAMLDAVIALAEHKESCCRMHSLIVGDNDISALGDLQQVSGPEVVAEDQGMQALNASQRSAVRHSLTSPLSLIWGPPGTGKTTVVVQILVQFLLHAKKPRILMTASTHNAVDNVLERFVKINKQRNIVEASQILRVATDVSKVNQDFREYTLDERLGGNMNENNKLLKKAEERLKKAVVVFSTCAGAGLGVLRKSNDFDITIVDEASQITEPCALIPLVKGIKQAVLVGDHVQLRPIVREMGKVLMYDVSLLERLYTGPDKPGIAKTMLDVQYRSPKELANFPSQTFYEGRLQTNLEDSKTVLRPLLASKFPWPTSASGVYPVVFVNCNGEESTGGVSKSNEEQAKVVGEIVKLLKAYKESETSDDRPSLPGFTILTPYTKQVQELKRRLGGTPVYTVDSFQGRESDIIIFSSVRCNAEGDLGFLEDERRLNVMWTRARLGLILVGSKATLEGNSLWKKAIKSCTEVELALEV